MSSWSGFDEDWLAERRAGNAPLTVGDVKDPQRWRPADFIAASHPSEEAAQEAVIRWSKSRRVRNALPGVELLFHVPNGGHRHSSVGAQMKAAGVRRGVPDLLLPVPQARYGSSGRIERGTTAYWSGLAIELKRGRNDVEHGDAQHRWLCALYEQSWATDVAHSARQCVALIEEYLRDPTAFVAGR